jgi:ATP-dependent DNA helicase RecG
VVPSFSNKAIQQFISNSKATFNYPSKDFIDWAIGFDLAAKTNENIVATKMGLLLFGENVDEIYSHSIFKVEIDYGDGNSEIKNITGPISLQLPILMDIIKDKALKLTIDRSEAERAEHIDFPPEILREVIANAIIHRDYSIEGANNYIYVSKDKIVIKSPGLPIEPFTIENIRTMDLPSVSRNPKIMYVYNRMGMAEARGFGLRSLKDLPSKGFPLPLFKLVGNILEITLVRNKSQFAKAKGFENIELSDEDKLGLVYIQNNEPITTTDYANEFDLTNKTSQRRLSALVDKGVITKEGEKRWTKYSIKKEV